MSRVLSILSAAVIGLAGAAAAPIGVASALQLRAGHESPRGPRPRPQPRNKAKERLAAAEAKRQRRQARNLSWAAFGGIGLA